MILKDKVVVVTGSSTGIGKAVAEAFAKEGSKVVLNSKQNETAGQAVAKELGKITDVFYEKADVSAPAGAKKIIDAALSKFGKLDILINNAGRGAEPDFLEIKEHEVLSLIEANFLSTFYCSQYAIKARKGDDALKIINTSSIRGWEWGARAPVYGAAKAAVNSLTRTLAKNYAPHVIVNAVAPGFTKTSAYDTFDQKMLDAFIEQTKLKRWITVDEMAEAYIFLAKNDAITGEVIYVDAGFMLK